MCATGFKSLAYASQPSRSASRGMAPPPANMSSTRGRGARPCSISSTVTGFPVSLVSRSACASKMCRLGLGDHLRLAGILAETLDELGRICPSERLSSLRHWTRSERIVKPAPMPHRQRARQATNGRRAHQRCRVEMCPLRTDFSRDASALIATMGR